MIGPEEHAMVATRRLVVELPEAQVAMIEARVASGEYASASALVSARIDDEFASPVEMAEGGPALTAFDARCAETLRRLEVGAEPLYPAEEVFARLREKLERLTSSDVHQTAAE